MHFLFIKLAFLAILFNCLIYFQTRTNYILKGLVPHALYFIQVQAITVQYSSKKLSSEKADIFIDTTNYKNGKYCYRVNIFNNVICNKLKTGSSPRQGFSNLLADPYSITCAKHSSV